MGKLIPIACYEALPGDTIQQSSAALIRFTPQLAPVMHSVSIRIHHWFVPNRLLWDEWESFITGGSDGLGDGATYPVNSATLSYAVGSLGDYLGLPTGVNFTAGDYTMLPFRAYNLIFNEFYRDEDLVAESIPDAIDLHTIAWEKDYFTRARPWAQKGPAVSIPIGGTAPVQRVDTQPFTMEDPGNNAGNLQVNTSNTTVSFSPQALSAGNLHWGTPNLEADLTQATSADVRAVRTAFALQRYQEARAQYGHRYVEYLRYLGIRPSDARLQRPEYLGGGKQTASFSEVLRTGEATGSSGPIGELKGHGIAAMRTNKFRYFCEEHGYVMSLLSVRPRTLYQDGLHRSWSRRTKEDYYQRELERVGQQEIRNQEIFHNNGALDDQTFGYQDRYADYRHLNSGVSGEFRSTLDYWHLGRKFSVQPVLNSSFTNCDPSKRIFAEQTAHSMWVMVNNSIQARRMLGKRTIGRIV